MDTLRTVTLSPGGRPIIRVNLADPTGQTLYTERSTFNLLPPTKAQNWSRSSRKAAGSVESGESMDNWTALASWWVKGGGVSNTTLQNIETLLSEIDDIQQLVPEQPKLLEWRPDGAGQSTYYELRGSGIYTPHYDWAAFAGAQMMKLDLSWPVAPVAQGLPLDIVDPFDVDSRADYHVDAGGPLYYDPGSYNAYSPYGAIGATGTPTILRLIHTARGYQYGDVQVTAGWRFGSSLPAAFGVVLCYQDANDYIAALQNASGTLQIVKVQGGASTVLATSSSWSPQPNTTYYVRARIEGNMLFAEVNPGNLVNQYATTASSVLASVSFVLSSIFDQAQFGAGSSGLTGVVALTPPGSAQVCYFDTLPYTYHGKTLPAIFDLPAVPGSASPKMDLQVTVPPSLIPAPISPGANSSYGSGGSWAAAGGPGAYTWYVTTVTPEGESLAAQVTATVPSNPSQMIVFWTAPDGAMQFNIRRTSVGGGASTATLVGSVSGGQTWFPDTGTVGPANPPPTGSSTSVRPPAAWALVGWGRRPFSDNRVWNGDFEADVDGWYTGSFWTSPYANHSASITHSTANPDQGQGHADIAPSSGAAAGAYFLLYRRFRAGVNYVLSARVAAPGGAGSANLSIFGGDQAWGASSIDGTPVTLATTYQTIQVTFTAPADANYAILAVEYTIASAGHLYLDQVQCFESPAYGPITNLVPEPQFTHVKTGQPPALWSKATNGPLGAAATSLVVTNNNESDNWCTVTCPTAGGFNVGASIPLGNIGSGQTVTASVLVQAGKNSQNIGVALEDNSLGNGLQSANVTITSTGAQATITVHWTPTAASPNARLYVYTPSPTSGDTFQIRSAIVTYGTSAGNLTYEDGDSPGFAWAGALGQSVTQLSNGRPLALASQTFGRGAPPTMGLLPAGAYKPLDTVAVNCTASPLLNTLADVQDVTWPSVFTLGISGSGSGQAQFAWWIDPHLCASADDFYQGSTAIEVFWRGSCPPSQASSNGDNYIINPRVIISAIPDPQVGSSQERFTQEFGTLGRQLAQPATPSTALALPRMSRAGTLVLPVTPGNAVRWKIRLTLTWSGGVLTFSQPGLSVPGLVSLPAFLTDYLLLAPANRRACNPTGKDRTDGTYPAFLSPSPLYGAFYGAQKTIRSNLRGRMAVATQLPVQDSEDTGLTGAVMELQPPPGGNPGPADQQILVKLSNLVPDDPTGESGEFLQYPATVHAAITPRYRLARHA